MTDQDLFTRPINKNKIIEALRRVGEGGEPPMTCTRSLPQCPVVTDPTTGRWECTKCGDSGDTSK